MNRFSQLRNDLNFINNLDIPKEEYKDKFLKVLPLISKIRNLCLQLDVEENV